MKTAAGLRDRMYSELKENSESPGDHGHRCCLRPGTNLFIRQRLIQSKNQPDKVRLTHGRQRANPRNDRRHRVGLCRQQQCPGGRSSGPDFQHPCRPDPGLDRCRRAGARAQGSGRAGAQVDHARLPDLPGRRPQIQIAEAPPAHEIQYEPRGIPGEMGPGQRLSDGCPQLCQGPVRSGQADGSGPGWP